MQIREISAEELEYAASLCVDPGIPRKWREEMKPKMDAKKEWRRGRKSKLSSSKQYAIKNAFMIMSRFVFVGP